jgi:hypothetical protein
MSRVWNGIHGILLRKLSTVCPGFKIVKVAYIKYPGRQKAMLGEIP